MTTESEERAYGAEQEHEGLVKVIARATRAAILLASLAAVALSGGAAVRLV